MTRCVIYARVSSEEQAGPDKTSIQTQLDDCRQLAAQLGWIITAEFVDDRRYKVGRKMVEPSGKRTDRPQWRKMLAALEAGKADALVCWHSSRLYRAYRPMVDLLDILDARPTVQVRLVKESFDKEFALLQGWAAKKDNDARAQRVVFGMAGRARQGRPPSSHSSFFRAIIEPATGEKLGYEFDERHRPYFDLMAQLFLARQPYHAIARQLGVSPVSGRPWSHVTVRAILSNPYYRGRLDYGRSTGTVKFSVPTLHRAVWDCATCVAIESELARRKRFKSPRNPSIPFAGLLFCGICGHPMAAATARARGEPFGRPYRQYCCSRPARIRRGEQLDHNHGPNWISENKLINLVQAQIDALSGLDVEDIISLLAAYAPAMPTATIDRGELDSLDAQIAELTPDLARAKSSAAKAAIDGELSRLKSQADMLRRALDADMAPLAIDFGRLRAGWASACRVRLRDLPDAELRAIVNQLFSALYLESGQIVQPPE